MGKRRHKEQVVPRSPTRRKKQKRKTTNPNKPGPSRKKRKRQNIHTCAGRCTLLPATGGPTAGRATPEGTRINRGSLCWPAALPATAKKRFAHGQTELDQTPRYDSRKSRAKGLERGSRSKNRQYLARHDRHTRFYPRRKRNAPTRTPLFRPSNASPSTSRLFLASHVGRC